MLLRCCLVFGFALFKSAFFICMTFNDNSLQPANTPNTSYRYLWPLIHYHKFIAKCIKKLKRNGVDVKSSTSTVSAFLRQEVCHVSDHLAYVSKYDSEEWTEALRNFNGWADHDAATQETVRNLVLAQRMLSSSNNNADGMNSSLLQSQLDEAVLKAMEAVKEEAAKAAASEKYDYGKGCGGGSGASTQGVQSRNEEDCASQAVSFVPCLISLFIRCSRNQLTSLFCLCSPSSMPTTNHPYTCHGLAVLDQTLPPRAESREATKAIAAGARTILHLIRTPACMDLSTTTRPLLLITATLMARLLILLSTITITNSTLLLLSIHTWDIIMEVICPITTANTTATRPMATLITTAVFTTE